MSNPSAFTWLPVEIVASILEETIGDLCSNIPTAFSNCSTRLNVGAGNFKNLLAVIQIDVRSSQIATSCPRIWRSLAELIITTSTNKNTESTMNLLSLCAANSKHTLDRLFLDEFLLITRCCKKKLDMLALITRSAASFKYLHLSFLRDPPMPAQCTCQHCSTSSPPTVAQVHHATLNLLVQATSLNHLVLLVEDASAFERFGPTLTTLGARPKTLQIEDQTQDPPDLNYILTMKQLASKATSFHLGVEGLRRGCTGEVVCLVGAAAANVVDLHLRATENELAITSITKHQLPKLSSLRVHPGSPMAFFNLGPAFGLSTANPTIPHPPAIHPVRAYLPTLVNVEGPAWLLSFIHAPNLRSLSVRHLDSHLDQDGLLKALGEYPKIEDLLIQSQVDNAIVTTRIFQRIIRSLTPGNSTANGTEKLLCPALRRLCFMARPLIIPDWLGPHAWKEYSTIPVDAPVERQYPFVKGSDLLELDKKRLEWSLKGPVETRCQSLNTIRFLDCFIDHRSWAKFLKTSKCENKWSSPDPSTENSKEAYREKYFPSVFLS